MKHQSRNQSERPQPGQEQPFPRRPETEPGISAQQAWINYMLLLRARARKRRRKGVRQ